MVINCLICKKEFKVDLWERKRGWGKYCSIVCKNKAQSEKYTNEKNPNWKGKKVSYRGLHCWIERKLGKPNTCNYCKKTNLKGHFIQWANISGEYRRELTDWVRLCVSCHMKQDGRDKNTPNRDSNGQFISK